MSGLMNQKLVMATAAASVTTASWTPRTRSAPTAMRMPSTVVKSTPMIGASGKPSPAFTMRCDMTNPHPPDRASCTTDTWPTKPVMTTSDSARTAPIIDVMSA